MNAPQASLLADGRRLHLNHGPIDLIIEAFGEPTEARQAYAQAVARFQTILGELVGELTELRRPAASGRGRRFVGSTAKRMESAVLPFAEGFITPMAAVAGAVADEIMAAMMVGRRVDKAYVNNGGDIALYVAKGQSLTMAIAGTGHGFSDRIILDGPKSGGDTHIITPTPNPSPQGGGGFGGFDLARKLPMLVPTGAAAGSPSPLRGGVRGGGKGHIRGVATSGWRGRSFSLGIADAVTVLGRTAAEADAAATIIANAVDLPGHPAIARQPARSLQADSDLGDRPVTVGVGALTAREIGQGLDAGRTVAETLLSSGLIAGAALFLCGESRVVGDVPSLAGEVHRNGQYKQYPTRDTTRSLHA